MNMNEIDTAPGERKGLLHFTLGCFFACWTLVLCIWLYVNSIRQGGVPCWDEFERCAWASHIWYDIRHLDFFHFWKHSNVQVVWPPLHSWMTGALFALFDPSLASGRLLSLAAFWGSGWLMWYWFARRNTPASWLGGAVAWCLYTTSPIAIQQAVGIMSEGAGLFLTLLILTLLPEKDGEPSSRWTWTGWLLGFFFLYKYNYAFLTYAGLFISRYFQAGASLRGMLNKNNLRLFGLPVLLMVLWFIPNAQLKWNNLIYFAVNNPAAHQPWGMSTLFYYPQVIPGAFFAHPWLCIPCLALVFIAAPLGWRVSLRNPALACCIVHFLAVSLHPMKMARFQFITMGLFFIVTGEALRAVLAYCPVPRKPVYRTALAATLMAALLFPTIGYQAEEFCHAKLPQQNPYAAPLLAVADRAERSDRSALFITHDLANPPASTFYLMTGKDLLQRDLRTNIGRWYHPFLFLSKAEVENLSLEERIARLRHELFISKSNKIVVIEAVNPDTIGVFPTVFSGVQEYIHTIPHLPEWDMKFQRHFPASQMNVRIYTQKPRM